MFAARTFSSSFFSLACRFSSSFLRSAQRAAQQAATGAGQPEARRANHESEP